MDRVRCVSGDLDEPALGLSPRDRATALDGLTTVWHGAARLALEGDPAPLHVTNVLGVRRVLGLLDEAPGAQLAHISTAFVAGRRDHGRIAEEDLREADGFMTYYEESKYTAERLVRAWAGATGRTATVLRPSLLVADRSTPAGLPGQPLDVLSRTIDDMLRAKAGTARVADRLLARTHRSGHVLRLRLTGDPDATINMLQVDYAARAMVRAVHARAGSSGLRTLHVTHPVDTGLKVAFAALASRYPGLRLTLEPSVPDPNRYEAAIQQHIAPLLRFATHRRTYDRANLLSLVGDLPGPEPIDQDYLTRTFAYEAVRERLPSLAAQPAG
ncbi:SDR family oxidoreductase [Streptomyces sp. LP05-1]|uniref:SDR family oxidoreductase n=1 Tax=Streptomyces pyxinae TaxID=2970734 RepID=A0ABT2CI06_9ACTN|nr:SDR family oxidoreductase [Streptomyces sp. LP05-1]MCS0637048.1 SDR family oxidoreductase [Streptomyces sp. LP05-1]